MKFTIPDEPFAVGYITCESDCTAMKVASGFLKQAQDMPLSIHEEWKLAGMNRPGRDAMGKQGVYFGFGQGVTVQPEVLREKAQAHPELAEEYRYILDYFGGKGTQQRVEDARTPQEKLQVESSACWGGRC